MPSGLVHLRIFLASPGDVADEPGLARQVIDSLQYDPFLRGKVSLEVHPPCRLGSCTCAA